MPKEKPTLEWLQQRASALTDFYSERNKAFDYYEKAENQEWELPEELKEVPWVMKSTTPQYAQALAAGTNIVAGKRPNVNVIPYDPSKKDEADAQEEALDIILHEIDTNRDTDLLEEMAHSMLKYGTNPVLVRYHKDGEKEYGYSGASQFTVDVYDASTVFPRFGARGLVEVMVIEDGVDVEEIRELYGADANELVSKVQEANAKAAKNGKAEIYTVRKFEHHTLDWHSVYCEIGGVAVGTGEAVLVCVKKWPHKFLPWSIRSRGFDGEMRQEAKYRSLLYNAYASDEVDLTNRVRSLRYSDLLRYAGAPRRTFQSDTRETPDIDASSGEAVMRIKNDEQLTDNEPWPPDPNIATLHAELLVDHEKNTLSSILLGGEIPSQAAFSSINLVTHSAMGALRPFIRALERQMADVLRIIMYYLYEDKKTYTGSKKVNGQPKEFTIDYKDIDPKTLRIVVQIDASLPSDNQARAATVGALLDRGVISKREGRSELGYRNDAEIQRQLVREAFVDTILGTMMQNIQTTENMAMMDQIRQQLMAELAQQEQMQQQMQQPVAQDMGVAQNMQQGQDMQQLPEEPMPETGIPSEANPAEGGPVPAQFNPGATYEGQTGETRGGSDVA